MTDSDSPPESSPYTSQILPEDVPPGKASGATWFLVDAMSLAASVATLLGTYEYLASGVPSLSTFEMLLWSAVAGVVVGIAALRTLSRIADRRRR